MESRYDRYDYNDRYNDRYIERDRERYGGSRGGRGGRDRDRDREEPTRVYVGNLASRTRDRDVQRAFDKYGPVSRVDMKNGFCFIEFADRRDADDAVRYGDGTDLDGKRLSVEVARGVRRSRATPVGGRGGGFRVKVENLNSKTSWQDLKDFARRGGDVAFTDVWMDRGKKFGVIEYSTAEDARKAVKELDGTQLDETVVHVFEDPNGGGKSGRSRSRSPRRGSRSPRRRSRSEGKKDSDSSASKAETKTDGKAENSDNKDAASGSGSAAVESNGDAAADPDASVDGENAGEGGDGATARSPSPN